MVWQRVLFGTGLAIVANLTLLLVFSYVWSVDQRIPDRDLGWGIPWLGSAIAATLLSIPAAFLVQRWKRFSTWWGPATAFAALSLVVSGCAVGCIFLTLWLGSALFLHAA